MNDTALVIMARYPVAGQTKTRLARSLGDLVVCDLYQAFLTDLAQRFAPHPFALHWAYTPAEYDYQAYVTALEPAHAHNMRCFPQQGNDLGARLHHAFQQTSILGFQHTILIGSDSPHITRDIVEQAREALNNADIVLGPAEDGGYYLIAMHTPHDVFSNIPMSTSMVLRMTIDAAERQGRRVQLLDMFQDVDDLSDLQRLAQLLAEKPFLAPATAAQLQKLGNVIR